MTKALLFTAFLIGLALAYAGSSGAKRRIASR